MIRTLETNDPSRWVIGSTITVDGRRMRVVSTQNDRRAKTTRVTLQTVEETAQHVQKRPS